MRQYKDMQERQSNCSKWWGGGEPDEQVCLKVVRLNVNYD